MLSIVFCLPSALSVDFSYRNGVKFGMTMNEVKRLEKNKPSSEGYTNYDPRKSLVYNKEIVVTYPCTIEYYFQNSALEEIVVYVHGARFTEMHQFYALKEVYEDIDRALINKYGTPDKEGADTFDMTTLLLTVWRSKAGERDFSIVHMVASEFGNTVHAIYYTYNPSPNNFTPGGGV